MNTERILKLADMIEATPHKKLPPLGQTKKALKGFNMGEWHCGTVGCIAGWASQIFNCRPSQAYEMLDLDWDEGDQLFLARGLKKSMELVTSSEAAAVLRNLAATGKVDWSIADKASQP